MKTVPNNLEGRVAIVTGGGQGIGAAIVEELIGEGALVGIVEINSDTLKEISDRLNREKENCVFPIRADVSNPADVERAVNDTVAKYGRLDIMVNNAGIFGGWRLRDITLDNWNKVINVNLTSAMLFCKLAAPHLAKNRVGSIINVTSIASEMGDPGSLTYAATKGGIQSFTRTLAIELADDNIRCNCVMPHAIKTPIMLFGGSYEAVEVMWKPRLPLRRLGDPSSVGAVVAFLAGDKANYVTGATYEVNGGISAQLHPLPEYMKI